MHAYKYRLVCFVLSISISPVSAEAADVNAGLVSQGQTGLDSIPLAVTVVQTSDTPESTAGPEVPIGAEFTYEICFDHDGLNLTDLALVDALAPEVTFVRADGDGTYGHYDPLAHAYTWQDPPLVRPKTCLRLGVRLKPDVAAGTCVSNSVTIGTAQTPPETTVVAGNGSGSMVGYSVPPFAEPKIVHGGKQSMPMSYDNVRGSGYSATCKTFSAPADWTVDGANWLVVYLRGETANKPTTLYLSIYDASGHSAWTEPFDQAMVMRAAWTEWRIPIALFTALGVDMTAVKQLVIGAYDKPDAVGATGTLYIDDIRVIKVPQ